MFFSKPKKKIVPENIQPKINYRVVTENVDVILKVSTISIELKNGQSIQWEEYGLIHTDNCFSYVDLVTGQNCYTLEKDTGLVHQYKPFSLCPSLPTIHSGFITRILENGATQIINVSAISVIIISPPTDSLKIVPSPYKRLEKIETQSN